MLDAPVSGGEEGARAGTLAIRVGGGKGVFEQCFAGLLGCVKGDYSHRPDWEQPEDQGGESGRRTEYPGRGGIVWPAPLGA